MVLSNLRRSIVVSIFFFVLLGLAYPLAETGIGQALFSHQANGSLTEAGSELIGQQWTGREWFHGRPDSDDPTATGGSNLGPRSQKLVDTYKERVTQLKADGISPTPDLVAASGSGVDPDISPDVAYAQVNAIATARGIAPGQVKALVDAQVHGPQWGFLGESHVNVLELNVALAALH
jgi:K+-transporting ATPase ATPase C chain